MAIRALIVDDEADARHNLQLMLEEQCPNVEVVGMAATADEARKLIGTVDPQALFLDIKMPGEDGFSLLRSLPEPHLPVVFTTAYDEFALRAFEKMPWTIWRSRSTRKNWTGPWASWSARWATLVRPNGAAKAYMP
ncbi:MAG: response regulator [Flavobacteriales bacterium]|nr:response regulator [Flavobacteriales bacterium]